MDTHWKFTIETAHEVALEYGYWMADARVTVDGEEVYGRGWTPFRSGMEARFVIDGKPCFMRVRWRFLRYETELWVDGKLY
jgi:hypothetical protein